LSGVRLGVDVGGTITDLVAPHDGAVLVTKVPSTPQNQSEGVICSVRATEIKAEEVVAFAHGATVATNALLERRGAGTALITTEGNRVKTCSTTSSFRRRRLGC
jgi:N-methylhydantoinase A